MLRRFTLKKYFSISLPYETTNFQFLTLVTQTHLSTSKQTLLQLFNNQVSTLQSQKGEKLFNQYIKTVQPIYDIIKKQIVTIDQGIEQFREPIHWSFEKSGKQIRPIIINMLSDTLKPNATVDQKQKIMKWSALVQILHIASLVHDDIIDDSPFRRGRQTVQSKFNKTTAIFAGNYIIGKGTQSILGFNDNRLYQIYSKMMQDLANGQLLQANRYQQQPIIQKIQNYMNKSYLKTGALISNSLTAVPIILKRGDIQKSFKIGQHLGVAFQLIDDVLDFIGDQKQMGKQVMSDLIDRNITLPILLRILMNPESNWKRLVIKKQQISKQEANEYRRQIMKGNYIQLTQLLALSHVNQSLRLIKQMCVDREIEDVWKYIGYLILTRNK